MSRPGCLSLRISRSDSRFEEICAIGPQIRGIYQSNSREIERVHACRFYFAKSVSNVFDNRYEHVKIHAQGLINDQYVQFTILQNNDNCTPRLLYAKSSDGVRKGYTCYSAMYSTWKSANSKPCTVVKPVTRWYLTRIFHGVLDLPAV